MTKEQKNIENTFQQVIFITKCGFCDFFFSFLQIHFLVSPVSHMMGAAININLIKKKKGKNPNEIVYSDFI